VNEANQTVRSPGSGNFWSDAFQGDTGPGATGALWISANEEN
jgi:hypothetical protein